jgi:hypothetical protein
MIFSAFIKLVAECFFAFVLISIIMDERQRFMDEIRYIYIYIDIYVDFVSCFFVHVCCSWFHSRTDLFSIEILF